MWSTVLSELAQVRVSVEWERPTWRVSWQDGPTREALMGRAAALGEYRVGAPLPFEDLRFARSNSAVAIALAWLARGSPESPAAARAAIAEVEAFCADTGYPQTRFDAAHLAAAELLRRVGHGDIAEMGALLAQAVPPVAAGRHARRGSGADRSGGHLPLAAFINAVTHELKTPIASIRLYLETLKTRDVDEDQRHEFYNIMVADTDRLLHTVEQVLRAGRTGHKRQRITASVINVSEMVQECLELTRVRYGLNETALIYSDSPEARSAKVSGDVDELRAAFSNLLDNAVKYSADEVQVSVSVAAFDDKRVSVRVTDKGIGIPSAQLKRIFKRFYRVPGRFMARVKGTGLGLFIVHSVITKHGGRVFAESRGLGHGSTFTVLLPRVLDV